MNTHRSECWAVEEARKAERVRASLLARYPSQGFEEPIRSSPRRQHPLTVDHEEHPYCCNHCLFEYPRICGRRQVHRQTGMEKEGALAVCGGIFSPSQNRFARGLLRRVPRRSRFRLIV